MGAKKKRRTFTAEFKAEVVEQVRASGKKPAEIARELGLSESSVRGWMRQADVDFVRATRAETNGARSPVRASRRNLAEPPPFQPEETVQAPDVAPSTPQYEPERAPPTSPPTFSEPAPVPAASAFRLVEARASLSRVSGHRPSRAAPAPAVAQPPPAPRRFALLAGAAAPLLVVGALFLARPAEGGAEAAPVEIRAVPSAVASTPSPAVTNTASHYVARTPAAPPPAPSLAPAPAPLPSAAPSPATAPAASVIPATAGTIVTTTTSHEHRIFVDGQTVGETGRAIEVRCGQHRARYGSQGRWQTIEVPCGGQYTLNPSW